MNIFCILHISSCIKLSKDRYKTKESYITKCMDIFKIHITYIQTKERSIQIGNDSKA